MHDLIAIFLESRSRIEGNRQSTVERLRRICCRWEDFLSSNRQRTLEKARSEDLLAFIAGRQDEGASEITIRGELCAIRTLYAYLLERQSVPWSPAAALPQMICDPPAEKDNLSVEECVAILQQIDTTNPKGVRDYVAIALLWSTGLRTRELCNLTWHDVNVDDGALLVREGKGGKQRHLFLNDRITGDLRALRKRTGAGDDEHLFPGAKDGTALSSSRLVEIVRSRAAEAGISKPVNPMTFRHTFATQMFEAGVSLEDLKELMGHADVSETSIYVHVSLDTAKHLLNDHAANPLKYS